MHPGRYVVTADRPFEVDWESEINGETCYRLIVECPNEETAEGMALALNSHYGMYLGSSEERPREIECPDTECPDEGTAEVGR